MPVPDTRRRLLPIFVFVLVGAVAALWWWTRPIVWEDAVSPPPPLAEAIRLYEAGDVEGGTERVTRFLGGYRAPAWEDRARVLAASRLAGIDAHERILEFLRRALSPDSSLYAHGEVLRARAYLEGGRPSRAVEAAVAAADVPGFPDHDEAVLLLVTALEKEGKPDEALARLDAEGSPEMAVRAARLSARRGDDEDARRRLQAILLDGPPGDSVERALETMEELPLDPAERLDAAAAGRLAGVAQRWFRAGRARAALRLLEIAREPETPTDDIAPDQALAEAEIRIRLGDLDRAEECLGRAAAGTGDVADGVRYLRGRLRQARGVRYAYLGSVRELAGRAGSSPWRLRALLEIAEMSEGKPSTKALLAYTRYREAAGDEASPAAIWREAWIAYELGRFSHADRRIEEVLAHPDAPGSARVAALYWSARRLGARGDEAAARRRYEELLSEFRNHYYGGLVEKRLDLEPAVASTRPPEPAETPGDDDAARWLDAARRLRSVGLVDAAAAAYDASWTAAGESGRAIALEASDWALENGNTARAVEFVRKAAGTIDAVPPDALAIRHWRLLMPAPVTGDLEAAARASGLEPLTVASVVLQESAFNPLALSPAGARGLLQLMPETGGEVAARLGIRNFDADRLFEPDLNLRLGCTYLSGLIRSVESLPVALAAYNAGATRARRWRVETDDADGERYVERIPIPATRSYVKRILANARMYAIAWPEGFEPGSTD